MKHTEGERSRLFFKLINLLHLSGEKKDCVWLIQFHGSVAGVDNRWPQLDPAPLISQAHQSLCVSDGIKCLCACAVSCRQPDWCL